MAEHWRLRMIEADRERYGAPEWVEYHADKTMDLPFDEVDAAEQAMGMSYAELEYREMKRMSARGVRALTWLALRQHGVKVDFVSFKPNVLRMDVVPVFDEPAGDADPPDVTGDSSEDCAPETS